MAKDLSPSLDKLASRIRAEHAAVAAAFERGAGHARNAGAMLLEAKRQVKHGEWTTWLAVHCELSDRTASNYMRIAKRWPEIEANRESLADLSQSKALEVISRAAPTKVVEYIPPSEENTREDFAAVEERIVQAEAILEEMEQADKPGGIKSLLGQAADYVASFAPAPPPADAEAEALEAFATAIIDTHRDAGWDPEMIRDSLFDIAELLLSCEHPIRWSGWLRAKGKEIVAEADRVRRKAGTGP